MESWDDDNFEPIQVGAPVPSNLNRWEGEDEDDEVKESWEDEDEDKEQKQEDKSVSSVAQQQQSKKKSLNEKIAEKERLKREEIERRLKEKQEEDLSPEEKLKRQKESDLNLALETTFGDTFKETITNNLDGVDPETKEDFQEYADAIFKKVQPLCKKMEYPYFAESLVRNLCATLASQDIKKIKTTIDNLYLEKQKIEKGDKAKKNKGKGKAKLKLEDENQFSAYVDDYNEYDDFM